MSEEHDMDLDLAIALSESLMNPDSAEHNVDIQELVDAVRQGDGFTDSDTFFELHIHPLRSLLVCSHSMEQSEISFVLQLSAVVLSRLRSTPSCYRKRGQDCLVKDLVKRALEESVRTLSFTQTSGVLSPEKLNSALQACRVVEIVCSNEPHTSLQHLREGLQVSEGLVSALSKHLTRNIFAVEDAVTAKASSSSLTPTMRDLVCTLPRASSQPRGTSRVASLERFTFGDLSGAPGSLQTLAAFRSFTQWAFDAPTLIESQKGRLLFELIIETWLHFGPNLRPTWNIVRSLIQISAKIITSLCEPQSSPDEIRVFQSITAFVRRWRASASSQLRSHCCAELIHAILQTRTDSPVTSTHLIQLSSFISILEDELDSERQPQEATSVESVEHDTPSHVDITTNARSTRFTATADPVPGNMCTQLNPSSLVECLSFAMVSAMLQQCQRDEAREGSGDVKRLRSALEGSPRRLSTQRVFRVATQLLCEPGDLAQALDLSPEAAAALGHALLRCAQALDQHEAGVAFASGCHQFVAAVCGANGIVFSGDVSKQIVEAVIQQLGTGIIAMQSHACSLVIRLFSLLSSLGPSICSDCGVSLIQSCLAHACTAELSSSVLGPEVMHTIFFVYTLLPPTAQTSAITAATDTALTHLKTVMTADTAEEPRWLVLTRFIQLIEVFGRFPQAPQWLVERVRSILDSTASWTNLDFPIPNPPWRTATQQPQLFDFIPAPSFVLETSPISEDLAPRLMELSTALARAGLTLTAQSPCAVVFDMCQCVLMRLLSHIQWHTSVGVDLPALLRVSRVCALANSPTPDIHALVATLEEEAIVDHDPGSVFGFLCSTGATNLVVEACAARLSQLVRTSDISPEVAESITKCACDLLEKKLQDLEERLPTFSDPGHAAGWLFCALPHSSDPISKARLRDSFVEEPIVRMICTPLSQTSGQWENNMPPFHALIATIDPLVGLRQVVVELLRLLRDVVDQTSDCLLGDSTKARLASVLNSHICDLRLQFVMPTIWRMLQSLGSESTASPRALRIQGWLSTLSHRLHVVELPPSPVLGPRVRNALDTFREHLADAQFVELLFEKETADPLIPLVVHLAALPRDPSGVSSAALGVLMSLAGHAQLKPHLGAVLTTSGELEAVLRNILYLPASTPRDQGELADSTQLASLLCSMASTSQGLGQALHVAALSSIRSALADPTGWNVPSLFLIAREIAQTVGDLDRVPMVCVEALKTSPQLAESPDTAHQVLAFIQSCLEPEVTSSPPATGTAASQQERAPSPPSLTEMDVGMIMDEDEDEIMEDEGVSDTEPPELSTTPQALPQEVEEEQEAVDSLGLVCSYVRTGSSFAEQHWYFCYTCNLSVTEGCCSVCAHVCHKGHEVVYSRKSRFFCDCGAGSSSTCRVRGSGEPQGGGDLGVPELEEGLLGDSATSVAPRSRSMSDRLPATMPKAHTTPDVPPAVAPLNIDTRELVIRLETAGIGSFGFRLLESLLSGALKSLQAEEMVDSEINKARVTVLRSAHSWQSASLNCHTKLSPAVDLPARPMRELRERLANGHVQNRPLDMGGNDCLMVLEKSRISFVAASDLTVERESSSSEAPKILSRTLLPFEGIGLVTNAANPLVVAIWSPRNVAAMTLFRTRPSSNCLVNVETGLDHMEGESHHVVRCLWLPGSGTQMLMVLDTMVKLFDLTSDVVSPSQCFQLIEESIRDADVCQISSTSYLLVVMSNRGHLYSHVFTAAELTGEPILLLQTLALPQGLSYSDSGQGIAVQLFAPSAKQPSTLIAFTWSSKTFVGRVNAEAQCVDDAIAIPKPQNLAPASRTASSGSAFTSFLPLEGFSGLFACLSCFKPHLAFSFYLSGVESKSGPLQATSLQQLTTSETVALAQIASPATVLRDQAMSRLIAVHCDGAVNSFEVSPSVSRVAPHLARLLKTPPLAAHVTRTRTTQPPPTFPLSFFEQTQCVTGSSAISFTSAAPNMPSEEGIKTRLSSGNDKYLTASSSEPLSITIHNSDTSQVIVGVRFQVGRSSDANDTPVEFQCFGRALSLDKALPPASKRWFDFPFIAEESLVADREFTVTFNPPASSSVAVSVIALEVYSQSKVQFGWNAKQAALAMRRNSELALLCRSSLGDLGLPSTISSGPMLAAADALRLLGSYIRLRRVAREESSGSAEPMNIDTSEAEGEFEGSLRDGLLRSLREPGFWPLRTLIKSVLRQLVDGETEYHRLKDMSMLEGIAAALSSNPTGCSRVQLVWWSKALRKIAVARPAHLSEFVSTHATLLNSITLLFWHTINTHNLAEPLLDITVHNLVVLCVATIQFSPRSFDIFRPLLFCQNPHITNVAYQTLISLFAKTYQRKNIPEATHKCDECSSPILPTIARYHCDTCYDYDVCQTCHDNPSLSHDESHNLVPVHNPSSFAPGQDGVVCADLLDAIAPELVSSLLRSHRDAMDLPSDTHISYYRVLHYVVMHLALGNPKKCEDVLHELVEFFFATTPPAVFTTPLSSLRVTTSASRVQDYFLIVMFFASLVQERERPSSREAVVTAPAQPAEATGSQAQPSLLSMIAAPHSRSPSSRSVQVGLPKALQSLLCKKLTAHGVLAHLQGRLQEYLCSDGTEPVLPLGQDGISKKVDTLEGVLVIGDGSRVDLSPLYHLPLANPFNPDTIFPVLAESMLQLSNSIFKHLRTPEGSKAMSEEATTEATAGWKTLLRSFIHVTKAYYPRKIAKRLLLGLCRSKPAYYLERDTHFFATQVGKVRKQLGKGQAVDGYLKLSHSDATACHTTLSSLAMAVGSRSLNWQTYLESHISDLKYLVGIAHQLQVELQIVVLKCLLAAFDVKSSDDQTSRRNLLEHVIHSPALTSLLKRAALECSSERVRVATSGVLIDMWHCSASSLPHAQAVFDLVMPLVDTLPAQGKRAREFMQLFREMLTGTDSSLLVPLTSKLTALAQAELTAASSIPSGQLYRALERVVTLDAHYLDTSMCPVCTSLDTPFTETKLENIKAETKFTDSAKFVKLHDSLEILDVTINMTELRRPKLVKTIHLYRTNSTADATELKSNWRLWERIATLEIGPVQNQTRCEFVVPLVTKGLVVEFAEFHHSPPGSEKLQCPRCSRAVADRHGNCRSCGDNAYQCRQCRNINYENLDAFLCNECGFCKWGRFEVLVRNRRSYTADPITNEDRYHTALAAVEKESGRSVNLVEKMSRFVRMVDHLLLDSQSEHSDAGMSEEDMRGGKDGVAKSIRMTALIYNKEMKSVHDQLCASSQSTQAIRAEVLRYSLQQAALNGDVEVNALEKGDGSAGSSSHRERCFGCNSAFLAYCLPLFELLASREEVAAVVRELVPSLLRFGLRHPASAVRQASQRLVGVITSLSIPATQGVVDAVQEKLLYCLHHHDTIDLQACIEAEMGLLVTLAVSGGTSWQIVLQLILKIFFDAINNPERIASVSVCQQIIAPCLRVLATLSQPPPESNTPPSPHSPHDTAPDGDEAMPDSQQEEAQVLAIAPQVLPGIGQALHRCILPTDEHDAWVQRGTALSSDNRSLILAFKYASRWRSKVMAARGQAPSPMWLCHLLLCSASQTVRSLAAQLVTALVTNAPLPRTLALGDMLASSLSKAVSATEFAREFLELFLRMVKNSEILRLYLVAKGLLSNTCRLILQQVDLVMDREARCQLPHGEVAEGLVLRTLVGLLSSLMESPRVTVRFREKSGMLTCVTEAYVKLQCLILHKTQLSEQCSKELQSLLHATYLDSECDIQTTSRYVAALVSLLRSANTQRRAVLLRELNAVLCPFKPDPDVRMTLTKSSTQEDFIRGSMGRNPYSSKAGFGPLMRDVKNRICRDLELTGLLEDDYGMELLVCGNIIKLDLPVVGVFNSVWLPHVRQNDGDPANPPPMVIVYRLAGLDGEATEEIVDTLEQDEDAEMDPEETFRLTGVMSQCGGLGALLDWLTHISRLSQHKSSLKLALRVLFHCCKVATNRVWLVKARAASTLLDLLTLALGDPDLAEIAELLLLVVEAIVSEGNRMVSLSSGETHGIESEDEDVEHTSLDREKQLDLLLDKLESVQGNQKITKTLTRILPFLTHGHPEVSSQLIGHFVPYLEFSKTDELPASSTEWFPIECFMHVLEAFPNDHHGIHLRQSVLEKGITAQCVAYLRGETPPTRQKTVSHEEDVVVQANPSPEQLLERPCMAYVLPMLTALSRRHTPTIRAVYPIMDLLHRMEGATSIRDTPAMVRALLDTCATDDEAFAEALQVLRSATQEHKHKLAMDHRQRAMAELGLRTPGEQNTPEWMEEIEDETGLACMVCREGYTFRPSEVLCCYVHCRKVILPGIEGAASPSRMLSAVSPNFGGESRVRGSSLGEVLGEDLGISTITHFNVIHLSCHQEATQAERAKRVPKEEWEGAALRNSQTTCNNIMPLWGPEVTEDVYAHAVSRFWNYMKNILPQQVLQHADSSVRFRVLVCDLEMNLLRLAYQQAFTHAEDARGVGSRSSNLSLVLANVQMGLFLLDSPLAPTTTQSQSASALAVSLSRSSSGGLSAKPRSTGTSASRAHFEHLVVSWLRAASAVGGSPQLGPAQSPHMSPALKGISPLAKSQTFMLALSLHLMPLKQWRETRVPVLVALLRSRLSDPATPTSSPQPTPQTPPTASRVVASSLSHSAAFTQCRPMLILFSLVDALHTCLKEGTEDVESKEWARAVEKRLRDQQSAVVDTLQGEVLSQYEDQWIHFEDWSEFFDSLEILPQILSGFSSVEHFVNHILAGV